MNRTYIFDIDGTICDTINGDYKNAVVRRDALNKINSLFDIGCKIIFYTSRGITSGTDWKEFTYNQLLSWGVKFHELIMGKPNYDVWIDDKAINASEWRNDI